MAVHSERYVSPVNYALGIGAALGISCCAVHIYLISLIPQVSNTESILVLVMGMALAVGGAQAWLLRLVEPISPIRRLGVIISHAGGGAISGPSLWLLLGLLKSQLNVRGTFHPFWISLGSLVGGAVIGSLIGWLAWRGVIRSPFIATILGWSLGGAACGWIVALMDAALIAGGY